MLFWTPLTFIVWRKIVEIIVSSTEKRKVIHVGNEMRVE